MKMTVMVAKFCYIRLAQLWHGDEEEDIGDDSGNGDDDDTKLWRWQLWLPSFAMKPSEQLAQLFHGEEDGDNLDDRWCR